MKPRNKENPFVEIVKRQNKDIAKLLDCVEKAYDALTRKDPDIDEAIGYLGEALAE